VGHWAEDLVEDVAQMVGGNPDRRVLREIAVAAGREIEVLAGRAWTGVRRSTSTFEPNGLPMVDVPGAHVGSVESARGVWEIPDPVDPTHATVLQLMPLEPPMPRAASTGEALSIAGQFVADASRAGRLSAPFVLHWLANSYEPSEVQQLFRRIMDPAVRFHVPILSGSADGWWFQISRRLIWATSEIEDEGRLLEMLMPEGVAGGQALPLAASEPVLIVARMTRQPVDWAFAARIWPEGVQRPADRRWSMLAKAVHGYGLPTITVDSSSTPQEIACQVILKSYWHGYIGGGEAALAKAVEAAYSQSVDSIRRHTNAPTAASAAAMLLEQLIHPGFDPAQGAEMTRRYVRRKASIVVMEHRKREHPGRYPWTKVGISERRFYKLLPLFAKKVNGRYDYDHDEIVVSMKAHLDSLDHDRAVRAAALEVLGSHGFGVEAARKWLQRHRPEEAVNAWPRGRRLGSSATEPAQSAHGLAR
jgi:hypothetical protein